ncbi:MAG TPA: discoidin domain-containing protein, partial [Opitutaceae bacterium]
SPAEAAKQFALPPGYSLEVVLSEPDIAEPVMIAFDGDGRIYVAEMLTYMQDVDGKGEMEPRSRVSVHESTRHNGVFDKHTIFADHLLLPRMLLTLDNHHVIIGETNTSDLYSYRDTNGDGKADEKQIWFEGGPHGGNLEHQPNGLLWALDNGIYSTYNGYRLRYTHGVVSKEEIPENQGQWGITQDNYGKVWFVNAGLELGPVHFQQHILYGRFSIEGEYPEDYTAVWPLGPTPDIQGGTFQLRANQTLNHFTATCGQDIFRGDRLPKDLRGDLLFAEPAGHLIRRTKVTVRDGVTHLENAYDKSEFVRTKDRLFRPVNMVTAPDGTLYIVDMYRGIVQEGNWTREGSYLRQQIIKYDLAKEIGRGRVYRLVHKDFKPGPQPHMYEETTSQLVKHLGHPNGWWRDEAQKLIILRGDKSVVPQLRRLGEKSSNQFERIHALWTLEGLDAITPDLVRRALTDSDPEIRRTGIRLSEEFIMKPREEKLRAETETLLKDPDPNVVIQAMESIKRVGVPDAKELAKKTAESSKSVGVYAINEQLWAEQKEDPFIQPLLGTSGLKSYRDGRALFNSVCFACHGENGLGTPSGQGRTIAPPLAHSPQVLESADAMADIVMHGLQGVVDGKDYGAPMVPMGSYSDQQLADVLTYIRNSFGNRASAVTPAQIAAIRKQPHAKFWTMAELEQKYPVLAIPRDRFVRRKEWKLSASHSPETLPGAVDDSPTTAYVTSKNPFVGMWVVVELPKPSIVKTIVMDSTGTPDAYPNTYDVQLSDDGKTWSPAIATGHGETVTQIHIADPRRAKFVKITLVDKTKAGWTQWAISDLEFYGDEDKTP